MGDRCYMRVTCTRATVAIFENLGFIEEGEDDEGGIEMVDEERNYGSTEGFPGNPEPADYRWVQDATGAHAERIENPQPLAADGHPYYGHHSEGGEYGCELVACDGVEFSCIPCDHDYHPVVRVGEDGQPDQAELEAVRRHMRIEKRAIEMVSIRPKAKN